MTRRNPDGIELVLLLAFAVGGFVLYERVKAAQPPQPTPGQDTNYPSGGVLGIATSGASGVTSYTSHPTGRGQIYV